MAAPHELPGTAAASIVRRDDGGACCYFTFLRYVLIITSFKSEFPHGSETTEKAILGSVGIILLQILWLRFVRGSLKA